MSNMIRVMLPEGPIKGLVVSGSPPRVDIFEGHVETHGLFVESLVVPGLTISLFGNAAHLKQALDQYEKLPRTLVFTNVVAETSSTLFGVRLPSTKDLGIGLKGFPPSVVAISSNSVVKDQFQLGQVVERLDIPSQGIHMSLASGGFTDQRVSKALADYAFADDRELVVKFEKAPPKEKGSNGWWDTGSFRNHSKWTLKRALVGKHSVKKQEEETMQVANATVVESKEQYFIPLVKAEPV